MSSTRARSFTIARRRHALRSDQVEDAMRDILPEPIASHFVVVDGRRYPPKQVIVEVTGLGRADFTSHQARRILMNLGFATGRRPPRDRVQSPCSRGAPDREPTLADELRTLVGQWVAVADDEVLVAASSPHDVVAWLSEHRKKADSMFRVPEDEVAAGGMAPL